MKKKKPLWAIILLILLVITFAGSLFTGQQHGNVDSWQVDRPQYFKISNAYILQYSELVPQPNGVPSAHASSVTLQSDGSLAVAWFAGSAEGAEDVAVYLATLSNGLWSEPQALFNRIQTMTAVGRHTHRIGNPVILSQSTELKLFYVSTDWGGWAMSKINYSESDDEGQTWQSAKRLVTGGSAGLSYLVRNNALPLADGNILLPIYFECGSKYPVLSVVSQQGNVVRMYSYPQLKGAIQPAIVPALNGNYYIYCRDGYWQKKRVLWAEITPDGRLVDSEYIDIANPDAAVAAITTDFGYFMVANPIESGRQQLTLFSSIDGKNWQKIIDLENVQSGEFSYPSVIFDKQNSLLHITYTYQRKAIKHVVVKIE